MKKTLVAIAALAAFGAAWAQSTVTLYGRVDASVGKTEVQSTGGLPALDVGASVNSGQVSGSRWGMQGVEDLGGGMKANFRLESGFNVDDGKSAQGGRLFGRAASVGLSGGFGSIGLGRQVTLVANGGWAITNGYANYDAWASTANNAGFGNPGSVATDSVRKDNSIIYATPNMGGLVGSLMWAPGENGTAAVNSSDYWSLGLDYNSGPIWVTFQYESDEVNPATFASAAGGTRQKAWILGGKYDMGIAALALSYQRAEVGTVEDRGWALGLNAPLGPVNLAFEYARETTETGGAFASRANALNLRVSYPLSKRTDVYAFLSDGKSRTAAGGTQDLSRYSLGVRHSF